MPETATQSETIWEQEFLRPGIYHGHEVTRDDLEQYAQNTNRLLSSGASVPVFTRHKDPGAADGGPVFLDRLPKSQIDALDNVGWLRGVEVRPDGTAVHRLEILEPEARRAIKEKRIKFTSPELCLNYRGADGTPFGKVIRHVALTPTPRNPNQGDFIPMSEPQDDGLVCVQFSLADRKPPKPESNPPEMDDEEGDGDYTSDEAMDTARPNVRTDSQQIAKQVLADLEAAGIAAPRGVDPLKDPLGFLAQLSTALRQKVITEAASEAKKDQGGDMSTTEQGISQYSEQQLVQFSETHTDPAMRSMAAQLLATTRKAAAEITASRRGKLRDAITKAPIPKFVQQRLLGTVENVQFSEDGADEPVMRLSEVLDLLSQATPKHLQFSDVNAVDTYDATDDFLADTSEGGVTDRDADAIADMMGGMTFSNIRPEELQIPVPAQLQGASAPSGRRR